MQGRNETEGDMEALIDELVRSACSTALDNAHDMGLHGERANDHLRVHWRGYIHHEAEAIVEESDWLEDLYETPEPEQVADMSVSDLEQLAIRRAPVLASEDDSLPALCAPVLESDDNEPRSWTDSMANVPAQHNTYGPSGHTD